MKQIAVKGDIYLIWEDTYKDPEKKIPPPPDPIDPEDPNKYTEPPYYDPLYNVDETDLPDTGEEFVFCNGKAVAFVGYKFSKVKKETYKRLWELDDEGHLKGTQENPEDAKHKDDEGHLIPPYKPGPRIGDPIFTDEKKDSEEADIQAVDGTDFCFIDGVPISCMNGGVVGSGGKYAVINGELVQVGSVDVSGEFTECFGHVYFES